jgi:hypothetical protein
MCLHNKDGEIDNGGVVGFNSGKEKTNMSKDRDTHFQTCGVCPEQWPAKILAYEDFSSETPMWVCPDCWNEHEDHMTLITANMPDDTDQAYKDNKAGSPGKIYDDQGVWLGDE